jgi:hypothetical protein
MSDPIDPLSVESFRPFPGAGEREPGHPLSTTNSVRNGDQQALPGSRALPRYVAERGSGSAGTAYNRLDWEVLDRTRRAARQLVCRATRDDALLIAAALNANRMVIG